MIQLVLAEKYDFSRLSTVNGEKINFVKEG